MGQLISILCRESERPPRREQSVSEAIASALNTVAANAAKAEARKRPDQRSSPAASKGLRRTSNANDANAANIAAADEDDFQERGGDSDLLLLKSEIRVSISKG